MRHLNSLAASVAAVVVASPIALHADNPNATKVSVPTAVMSLHAQGAQVYECKAEERGALVWQFREPIATLIRDGVTVGRHYAGPRWEMIDGSVVTGKVAARAPGITADDIPLLLLEARGDGVFAEITTIHRLNTRGGVANGPCPQGGLFLSVPYSADYAFFKTRQPLPQ